MANVNGLGSRANENARAHANPNARFLREDNTVRGNRPEDAGKPEDAGNTGANVGLAMAQQQVPADSKANQILGGLLGGNSVVA